MSNRQQRIDSEGRAGAADRDRLEARVQALEDEIAEMHEELRELLSLARGQAA